LARGRLREPVGLVTVLVGKRDELRAEFGVARGELGAQQRLPLPDRGAVPVIGRAGGKRTDKRALLALGPQVRVDQQRRVGCGPSDGTAPPTCPASPRCRRAAASMSGRSASSGLGTSSASSANSATASGARSSRPVAYRLDASTVAIRPAALVSSRSSRRNQGV